MKDSGLLLREITPIFQGTFALTLRDQRFTNRPGKSSFLDGTHQEKIGIFHHNFLSPDEQNPLPFATSLLKHGNQRQLCRVNSCAVFDGLFFRNPSHGWNGKPWWLSHPSEKYAEVKLGSFPQVGLNIKHTCYPAGAIIPIHVEISLLRKPEKNTYMYEYSRPWSIVGNISRPGTVFHVHVLTSITFKLRSNYVQITFNYVQITINYVQLRISKKQKTHRR